MRYVLCILLLVMAGCAAVPKDFHETTLDDMYPILSTEEYHAMEAIGSDADMARFVESYWLGIDSTENGPVRMEYASRLAYANEKFPDRRGSGHSDRKRIYVLHGPPAFIDRSEFVTTKFGVHSTMKAMEIWVYLEPGRRSSFPSVVDDLYPGYKRFVFADLFSTGNYTIIFSTEDEDDIDLRILKQH